MIKEISSNLPNLENLFLMGNKIGEFREIEELKNCKNLKRVILTNNPIIYKNHYRLYVINLIKGLVLLDFVKVAKHERITA